MALGEYQKKKAFFQIFLVAKDILDLPNYYWLKYNIYICIIYIYVLYTYIYIYYIYMCIIYICTIYICILYIYMYYIIYICIILYINIYSPT